jgi:predicted DNA-binding transcriptional regulator AlpA
MREAHTVDAGDRLLRTQEVAAWLAVSKSTLVRWRQSFEGPDVYWLSEGVPRYRASDVERWLAGRSAARPRALRRVGARAGATR